MTFIVEVIIGLIYMKADLINLGEKKDKDKDLVVQTNSFINAIHCLTLSELRILELIIVEARENNIMLTPEAPLSIDVELYADRYNLTWEGAYQAMIGACETFKSKSWKIRIPNRKLPMTSNYLQDFLPIYDEGRFEITLTRMLIAEIAYLDGRITPYTSYYLKQSSRLSSVYAVRLFQILSTWRDTLANTKKFTPIYTIEDLRDKFGIDPEKYKLVADFKKKTIDIAVLQINENTDLTIDYEVIKRGRLIKGFRFLLKTKKTLKHEGKVFETITKLKFSSHDQLRSLSGRLIKEHALVGNSRQGASFDEIRADIEKDLSSNKSEVTNKYIPFIKKHGFEAVIKTEKIEVTPPTTPS